MKTIIFPTDFSENASNAMAYAIAMAKKLDARLILLNTFILPSSGAGSGLSGSLLEILRKESESQLALLKARLGKEHPELKEITTVSKLGDLLSNLSELIAHTKVSLVVMGTQGATGLQEIFIGSNAQSVIKKLRVPVMVIPAGAIYKKMESIVYATDFNVNMDTDREALEQLKELCVLLNVNLKFLHVQQMDGEATSGRDKLETLFTDVKHSFCIIRSENFEAAVNEYMEEEQADILCMLSRKHGFFDRFINGSKTESMVMHTKIPLLTVREK